MPNANNFQDIVATDLQFYQNKILLHMIDHATHLSPCARIPSKRPKSIIKAIFFHWISVYGAPKKSVFDNRGEFINEKFIDMCESFNISYKTTSACGQMDWLSDNITIAETMDKVLEEANCDYDIALTRCIKAKSSLQNMHGLSPYKLAI